ncbi:hypothetical protein A3C89_02400 [Candidatus Kaiserbacteria bacterium RIFCSPHIGHO2_02_FULL_50_50]|uniref:Uncharacterized protein n=1 Tax=Candidatus Kaiserbacteria bacterium RIFCSPHIGHO2_02_FULL_50_50 TaxID=1798492 RepID=A0A1F6DD40_9BACT|nr:MAG: hypothetical protein A3C89_02400 [Candidatus Kaiserbacteria bacterium RIFCSPHIGHO2_02_FULL_50_50]OGG88203.1 MAG: hypothetical protein A3G62_00405 [Candidatus Kaiserbacteria bacterium RIFCSPLOWO2_12_FULL_50_10]
MDMDSSLYDDYRAKLDREFNLKADRVMRALYIFLAFCVLLCATVFYFSAREEKSREAVVAEVVAIKKEHSGGSAGVRYDYLTFKIRIPQGEFWSAEEVRIKDCPQVFHGQLQKVWLVRNGYMFREGGETYTTEGLITFCKTPRAG